MNTYVPFSGFYYSIHDHVIDQWTEINEEQINYKATHIEYSKDYVNAFNSIAGLNLKFIKLISPQYYNYETDVILCSISKKEVKKLFKEVDKDRLAQRVKEKFTSYDGFISFYDNDYKLWGKVENWDENQLQTLLEVCFSDIDEECAEYVMSNGVEIVLNEELAA